MAPGAFSKAEQVDLIPRLRAFLQADLDVEISDLQAGMLLDFMARAASSHERWMPTGDERDLHHRQALARWYPEHPRPRRGKRPAP